MLNGEDYHGIKNKPYAFFVTGFFDNETDNTVGIQFKTDDGALAVLCVQISGKLLANLEFS